MPLFHKNIICVTIPELVKCGISEKYTKLALNLQRQGKVVCWPHHKDGNKVYIHYNGIKEKYQELIRSKICNGEEVDKWLAKSRIEKQFELSPADDTFLFEFRFHNGSGLDPVKINKYREACKVLFLLKRYIKKEDVKRDFQLDVFPFYDQVIEIIKKRKISLPTSYSRLNQRLNQYIKEGASSVISKKFGNKNTAKIGKTGKGCRYNDELAQKVISVIVEAASQPQNHTLKRITEITNSVTRAHSMEPISLTTVWNILNNNGSNHAIHIAGTRGMREYNNSQTMQVKRKRPEMPLQMVSIDGWDVELLYQETYIDKSGRSKTDYNKRPMVVVVLDPFLDYPIGYAIGERETADLIRQANRDAILHARELFGDWYRPLQVQSDHFAISSLTPFYNCMGKHFTPAAVGNARSKPVEAYFNYLNREYFQVYPNWNGHNITARAENQPNKEWLDKIKHQFPVKHECYAAVVREIERDRAKKHEGYMQAWSKMPEGRRSKIGREQFLMLLGETNHTYNHLNPKGITPRLLGERRHYDTFDPRFRELNGTPWKIYYEPTDLSTVLAVSKCEKYSFLLTAKYEQPMALADRRPGDAERLQQIMEFNKHRKDNLITQRLINIENTREMISTGDPSKLSPEQEVSIKQMFTVKGQQKQVLQEVRKPHLIPIKPRDEEQSQSDWIRKQQEYMRQDIDFDKYMD